MFANELELVFSLVPVSEVGSEECGHVFVGDVAWSCAKQSPRSPLQERSLHSTLIKFFRSLVEGDFATLFHFCQNEEHFGVVHVVNRGIVAHKHLIVELSGTNV